MNKRDFIKKIRLHLKEHGFKLVLSKKEYVDNDGFKCRGVFRSGHKDLLVAQGHTGWFETTVHEYCHFLQYVEKSEFWSDYCRHGRAWWKRMQ